MIEMFMEGFKNEVIWRNWGEVCAIAIPLGTMGLVIFTIAIIVHEKFMK